MNGAAAAAAAVTMPVVSATAYAAQGQLHKAKVVPDANAEQNVGRRSTREGKASRREGVREERVERWRAEQSATQRKAVPLNCQSGSAQRDSSAALTPLASRQQQHCGAPILYWSLLPPHLPLCCLAFTWYHHSSSTYIPPSRTRALVLFASHPLPPWTTCRTG